MGKTVDRKGDEEANAGEYNARHGAVLRAMAAAIRAGAIGPSGPDALSASADR